MVDPIQRRIDSKGRIDVPDDFWKSINLKNYDLVWIVPKSGDVELRKTLETPAPNPTPTPTPTPDPSTILFKEDFSGFGDYEILQGQNTKDGKMKNIWGIMNVMHDAEGSFVRIETPYHGDGGGVSALLLTNQSFGDCKITYKSRIIRYTWTAPTNYAAPWFMRNYTDVTHHYYEYLQRDGDFEVGKKDNLSTDSYLERQLFCGPQPHLMVPLKNVWYTYEWTSKSNADGTISHILGGNTGPGTAVQNVYNYTDHDETSTKGQYYHLPTTQLQAGRLGPYGEDIVADYKDIVVTSIV
jgi:hypothetical protein